MFREFQTAKKMLKRLRPQRGPTPIRGARLRVWLLVHRGQTFPPLL